MCTAPIQCWLRKHTSFSLYHNDLFYVNSSISSFRVNNRVVVVPRQIFKPTYSVVVLPYTMGIWVLVNHHNRLRLGSSSCSIWIRYTSFVERSWWVEFKYASFRSSLWRLSCSARWGQQRLSAQTTTQCNIEKQRPYKTWPSKKVGAVNNWSTGS